MTTFPCRFCGGEHPLTTTVCPGRPGALLEEAVQLLRELAGENVFRQGFIAPTSGYVARVRQFLARLDARG